MLEKGARLATPASERVPTRQIGLGPGKVVANWTLSSFSMLAISAAVIITSQDYQDIRVRKYFIELFAVPLLAHGFEKRRCCLIARDDRALDRGAGGVVATDHDVVDFEKALESLCVVLWVFFRSLLR